MRKKKTIIMVAMMIAILFMSVGYALLSTRLDISGSTAVTSTWNVEFSGIRTVATVGGAVNKIIPTVNATTASFEVNFVEPGDSITYEIDITNYGDIDAEVQGATYRGSGSDAVFVKIEDVRKGTLIGSCEGLTECPFVTLRLTISYEPTAETDPSKTTKDIDITLNIAQYVEGNPTADGELIPEGSLGNDPVSLVSQILADNEVKSDTNINFGAISSDTNGKGLYYTNKNTEGNNTVYYFRGAVDNNYVKFGKRDGCSYNNQPVAHILSLSPPNSTIDPTQEQCVSTYVCDAGTVMKTNYGMDYKYVTGLDPAVCAYLGGTPTTDYATYGTKNIDILWRIVRINEDGSVRLVTEHAIGQSLFNQDADDNAYVGYMFGEVNATGDNAYELTHTNTNDSTMKDYLDDWYSTKSDMTNYTRLMSTAAGFCSDRSIAPSAGLWYEHDTALGYGEANTVYGAFNRLVVNQNNTFVVRSDAKPQYACPNVERDLFTVEGANIGNNELTYPIGMLTADEIAYAGGSFNETNIDFYLRNGWSYWTMSPFLALYAMNFTLDGNGLFIRTSTYNNWGVRPVINLDSSVLITDGEGTNSNPYIIKID